MEIATKNETSTNTDCAIKIALKWPNVDVMNKTWPNKAKFHGKIWVSLHRWDHLLRVNPMCEYYDENWKKSERNRPPNKRGSLQNAAKLAKPGVVYTCWRLSMYFLHIFEKSARYVEIDCHFMIPQCLQSQKT